MTYPKHVTIDTSGIWSHGKARELEYADTLDAAGFGSAAAIVRAFANALPHPWPTAPGSTARADARGWSGTGAHIACLNADGRWYVLGYPDSWTIEGLIAAGFAPLHDAGADQ